MAQVKAGDVVHLKSDSEVLFTVIEDIGASFNGKSFNGMFRILSFDKLKNNTPVELEVHYDALVVVNK